VSILYVFLAQFWYHIAIIVLAAAIYFLTRLRGRRISGEESIERAALSIVVALTGAFMLGAAIIIPAGFVLIGVSALDLSDSPLVTAIPKYRGLPVILWVFAGLAVTASFFHLFWLAVDWVRSRLRRSSTGATLPSLAVRSVDRRR
jgi:hypothetical protein